MSTSVLGHYVRFGESAIDGLDPVDSGMAQRALGNLNHLADQYAQVRVKWVLPTGIDPIAIAETGDGGVFVGGYQRMWTSDAFDLHVRGDGSTYRCRLSWRLGAASGTGTEPIFRAVLAPAGESADELFSGDVNTAEHEMPDASIAWVQHGSLLYLDAARVRRATRSVAAINEVGGATASATWLRCELSIWAFVESPADDAVELGGVELEEYYAP